MESISYPSIRVHISHYYLETLQVSDAQIDYYIIGIPDNANKTTYRFLSINENLINTEEIVSKLIMRFESISEAKEYLSMIYKVMQSDHGLICNKMGVDCFGISDHCYNFHIIRVFTCANIVKFVPESEFLIN